MWGTCKDGRVHGATHQTIRVGWREWVRMPSVNVPWIKTKIDTGARSSAVHAFDLERFERDGEPWVRFSIHPWQASDDDAVVLERPVVDERVVRSSNGHSETRLVVELELVLARRRLTTEVTLSRRDEMGFRMLIGRETLRHGFLVDPAESYLGPRPKLHLRRRNRGRG
ncbi:ATP-dependent zinc protease [Knoellia flava]|nr:ATP-dependent zinc protease [Knoellia flava]